MYGLLSSVLSNCHSKVGSAQEHADQTMELFMRALTLEHAEPKEEAMLAISGVTTGKKQERNGERGSGEEGVRRGEEERRRG